MGAGGLSREPSGQRVVLEYWRPECCPGLAKGTQAAGAFEVPPRSTLLSCLSQPNSLIRNYTETGGGGTERDTG